MAEGLARDLLPDACRVESAGINAHGLNRHAVEAMSEIGIDISSQESSEITQEQIQNVDLVVTVCKDADRNCPVLPKRARKLHWPLDDPAVQTGDESKIRAVFRSTRNLIRGEVEKLAAELEY